MALALRPFSSRRSNEIIAAPKIYGFGTGFVCAHRGWTHLRPDDLGQLWEHYVRNELTAQLQTAGGHYWRDKQGYEVVVIRAPRGKSPTAIECKWSARDFNPANLLVFDRAYMRGVGDQRGRASLRDEREPERELAAVPDR